MLYVRLCARRECVPLRSAARVALSLATALTHIVCLLCFASDRLFLSIQGVRALYISDWCHCCHHDNGCCLQVVRSNAIGTKGALSLAKALTSLTCLDLANNPIGRRASRQLAPLMAPAEVGGMADTDSRCW